MHPAVCCCAVVFLQVVNVRSLSLSKINASDKKKAKKGKFLKGPVVDFTLCLKKNSSLERFKIRHVKQTLEATRRSIF